MAKTKLIPRKHTSHPEALSEKQIICPVCKDVLSNKENFASHVMMCSEMRVKCETCGQTFKKKTYLAKHQKKYHPNKKTDTGSKSKIDNNTVNRTQKTGINETTKDVSDSSNSGSSDSDSDLGEDPDIELQDEICGDQNIISGRVVRKATTPLPVCAPKKAEISDTVCKMNSQKSEPRSEQTPENIASKACVERAQNTEKSHQDSYVTKKGLAEITVEILKSKYSSSDLCVLDDGERIFSTYSVNKSEDIKEEPELNLSTFLPKDAIFKAEDVKIKRVLSSNGGKIIMKLNYEIKE